MAVDTLKYDELLKKTFTTLNSYVESEWPVVKQTVKATLTQLSLLYCMICSYYFIGSSYCKRYAFRQRMEKC